MMICDNLSVNASGHLCFAGRDTLELAACYGTPLYVMDEQKIREKCRIYKTALEENIPSSLPLYASKACSFVGIYRIMAEEGMGIDLVSPGELFTALKAGFPMQNAYLHGNNKTDRDLDFAMKNGVGYIVCDSADELEAIETQAAANRITQKLLLRLTPGIDPHTHAKISTGQIDSKFGVSVENGKAEELVKLTLAMSHVKLCGFHCHVGSQTFGTEPFTDAAAIMLGFCKKIQKIHGYQAEILNLGGGMAVRYTSEQESIDYRHNIKVICDSVKSNCKSLDIHVPSLRLEPGRSIVADAGLTLYTVGSYKEIPMFKNYVSVDGGMPDNPRYALYEAPYTVYNAGKMQEKADILCSVVGRCCESGDIIQEKVKLPACRRGDILAVLTTGAYNYSMASNYNRIPRPPIVMLGKDKEYTAVKRESFEDLVRNEL